MKRTGAMGYSNGVITKTNIGWADIADALGLSRANFELGYACKNTHGNTNPWARFKPVRYNKLFTTSTEKWWKASDGNCGIVPKSFQDYRDIYSYCDGTMNGWVYQPPIGGETSPFRATDFGGYDHNADVPISNFQCPSSTNTASQFTCTADVMVNFEEETESYLTLNDLDYIKSCYFGIVAKKGTSYKLLTSTFPIGTAGAQVTMPSGQLSAGSWEIYPFVANKVIGINDGEMNNITYYSIPYMVKKNITVSSVASGISISIEQVPLPTSAGYVEVPVYINNNNSGMGVTLTGGEWKCRFAYNDFDADDLTTESRGTITPDRTIPAGGDLTINLNVNVTSQLLAYKFVTVYVKFLANGTRYVSGMEFAVEQELE